MKIVIGLNTFKTNKRQDIAVKCLQRIESKYESVKVVNVQFDKQDDAYDCFEVNDNLTRYSTYSDKQLPYVNDIFEILSTYDCDYFIFLNSDILLNPKLIEHIQNKHPTAFAISRYDIAEMNDIDDSIKVLRCEIAGFDAFVFKKEWYLEHKHLFVDMLLGRPLFDQYYALMIKMNSPDPLVNTKPYAFHMIHQGWYASQGDKEQQFNETQEQKHYLKYKYLWGDILNVFIRRQPWGAFLQFKDDEKQLVDNLIVQWKKYQQ
jgi:hypothetical protein